MEQKDRLSRNDILLIKKYCFNNLKECYERHNKSFNCALTTFYKAMEGGYISKSLVENLESFAKSLTSSVSDFTKYDMMEELITKIDKFSSTEKMEDWIVVKEWIKHYRDSMEMIRANT